MVASNDLVPGADEKVGASADEMDAPNKTATRRTKVLTRRRNVNGGRTKKFS